MKQYDQECRLTSNIKYLISDIDCLSLQPLRVVLSPRQRRGGKSGQHRVPYFLTGRSRQLREQKVPQKITATPQAW